MAPKSKTSPSGYAETVKLLLDQKKPAHVRARLLVDMILSDVPNPDEMRSLFTQLLQHVGSNGTSAEAQALKEEYRQALSELESGPARPATYIGRLNGSMPGPKPRLHVVTPDGQERFPTPHPDLNPDELHAGMTIYLDPKGAVALGAGEWSPRVGQEAVFLRRLPDTNEVEVSTLNDERVVHYASQHVLQAIEDGELKHGDRVLTCLRRQFVFNCIPTDTDRKHRFLDTTLIPDVEVGRDIGKPHWILGRLLKRTRMLLYREDLYAALDLRPLYRAFLTGPPGTGKTLTIRAFLREFYLMLSDFTGDREIGSRVIRLKASDLLSEWFGRTDKNIDDLFDDIHSLASEEFDTPRGRKKLPCVVVFEEAEGLSKRRGHDVDGGVYDRVIGTLLQRLDDTTSDLSRLPIIWLTTSNRADLIDSAMWRRLAGVRAHFSRLDRQGLAAVLSKKLKPHLPYASRNGTPQEEIRRDIIDQIVSWLFSPNGEDRGQVEITMRDGAKLIKHRRDFVTGSVVEQGVANAIDHAAFAAETNGTEPALNAEGLIESLRGLIDGMAENLTAANAADYLDLPEHTGVASVRRLRPAGGRLTRMTR